MVGGRVGQKNVQWLLNSTKIQSEVDSHEFIEVGICFIVIFSLEYLCYLGTDTNRADTWVHPGMGFYQRCDKRKGKKEIIILVRVFWCDRPWDLNWGWRWWRKEGAGELGNESGDGKLKRSKNRNPESYWTCKLEREEIWSESYILELVIIGWSTYGARYNYGSRLLR